VEEHHAQALLQRADLAAHGGLRDVEPFGRGPEARRLGHGDQRGEVVQVQPMGHGGFRLIV
jgi:hypothetical protein